MIRSGPSSSAESNASIISVAAFSPCTEVGTRVTSRAGYRLPHTANMSLTAAPEGDDTIAMCLGYEGSGFFDSSENKPSDDSFIFSCSYACLSRPSPACSI